MPINNLKKANNLSTNILNYFAAFTETRFNFRTLINYRWTNSELTLDLAIFQDFQDTLLQRIKAGDKTPIRVKAMSIFLRFPVMKFFRRLIRPFRISLVRNILRDLLSKSAGK